MKCAPVGLTRSTCSRIASSLRPRRRTECERDAMPSNAIPRKSRRPEYPDAWRWCERLAPKAPEFCRKCRTETVCAEVNPGAKTQGRPAAKKQRPPIHAPSEERLNASNSAITATKAMATSVRASQLITPVAAGLPSGSVMRAPASAMRYQVMGRAKIPKANELQ